MRTSLFAFANVALIALGLVLALRGSGWSLLERAGARAFALLSTLAQRLAQRSSFLRRFALGLLWGCVPCSMVYGVLALATLSGDAGSGAALAFVFGVGTLPNLMLADWLLRKWQARAVSFRRAGPRLAQGAVGLVLVGYGLLGLLRPELSWSAFCVAAQ